MKDSKRTWLIFAGILGFLVVFSSAIVLLRRAEQADQLQRLYLEASCVYPYFRSSSESAEAVHKIGAYPGERAEKMLFTLARGPSQCVVSNVQPDAVYELRKRHDPNVAPFLAGLLKPETVMDTRRAIAEALQDLPCDQTCTTEVLHYLDQIDKGELNSEDTGLPDSYASSELHQQVEETITAKQTEIYDLLYVALMRNSSTTNSVLTDVYRLGTADPERFSIDFAVRSNDKDECPALVASARAFETTKTNDSDDRQKMLKRAIESLKCKVNL